MLGSFTSQYLPSHYETDVFISVNGCSLKTEENMAAVKVIDLRRIMFETGTFVTQCHLHPLIYRMKRKMLHGVP